MINADKYKILLETFRDGLIAVLGDKLFGIYLYGAITFPETKYTGDLDFHVILTTQLTQGERKQLEELHESLARNFPPLGSEMDGYYLLLEDAKRISPPQSQMWKRATDNAWALHREHIRAGKCIVLYGPEPTQIYRSADWVELELALRDELNYVEMHLKDYPAYCILNLFRLMYSYQTRDVVVSKTAAGTWGEETYPQWKDLIDCARRSYEGLASGPDEKLILNQISDLCSFVLRRIAESLTVKHNRAAF
ncbi:MAG TPA: aminoglycoside adenylyltransferase domain-containing protein [candidate division Zixibacteria bacterium]|nr:aminoglycoside adenylyltransferase domain-containing protein [candidate division Zixibacteria bacterium]